MPAKRITIFQSRQTVLKGTCLLIGGPSLGLAASVASTVVMVGDGSATPGSVVVSFTLLVLGIVPPLWLLRKAPAIGPEEADGWHEVRKVHPAAIERLRELQERIPAEIETARSNT